jgi:hypothetical protein
VRFWNRKSKRKPLQVGDKIPPDVDLSSATGNMGGFVSVCPCCRRIDAIFIP